MNTTSLTSYAQTAYRPGISCRDSIFAGLEAERKFVDEVDTVYTSFFDLDSAFDTVEFCVLLCELFNAGVKGKCWRLFQNWHSNITSKVKLGKPLSQSFSISISKGIRKGSVLSPTLFNLSVIDPLLKNLQEKSLGLSINSLFFGYFAHADDIRALRLLHAAHHCKNTWVTSTFLGCLSCINVTKECCQIGKDSLFH